MTGRRVFGRPPAALIVPAVAALCLLIIPIVALVVRAPWRSLGDDLTGNGSAVALRLSLETTLITTGVCLVLGVPLAWLLARVPFPGRSFVRALVILPLVMPPVVGGVALLQAFGTKGLVGRYLDQTFGITIAFTTSGVVMAQSFVALPFLVIAVEGAFRASDTRYDDAAATLGASRWHTFRRVTVPLALPGIVSGAVLCWARALGEFGATIMFNGSLQGVTRTMPSQIFYVMQLSVDSAIALSLVMVVICIGVLALLRERWLTGLAS